MKRMLVFLSALAAASALVAAYNPDLTWKYDTSNRTEPVVETASAQLADFSLGAVQAVDSGLTCVEAMQFWPFVSDGVYTCDFTLSSLVIILR